MLSRKLKAATTAKEIQLARRGQLSVISLAEPNVMVVTNRKDRMAGAAVNHSVDLEVTGGMVIEPSHRDNPDWAAA